MRYANTTKNKSKNEMNILKILPSSGIEPVPDQSEV